MTKRQDCPGCYIVRGRPGLVEAAAPATGLGVLPCWAFAAGHSARDSAAASNARASPSPVASQPARDLCLALLDAPYELPLPVLDWLTQRGVMMAAQSSVQT